MDRTNLYYLKFYTILYLLRLIHGMLHGYILIKINNYAKYITKTKILPYYLYQNILFVTP